MKTVVIGGTGRIDSRLVFDDWLGSAGRDRTAGDVGACSVARAPGRVEYLLERC
jgi:hypothetical protein